MACRATRAARADESECRRGEVLVGMVEPMLCRIVGWDESLGRLQLTFGATSFPPYFHSLQQLLEDAACCFMKSRMMFALVLR